MKGEYMGRKYIDLWKMAQMTEESVVDLARMLGLTLREVPEHSILTEVDFTSAYRNAELYSALGEEEKSVRSAARAREMSDSPEDLGKLMRLPLPESQKGAISEKILKILLSRLTGDGHNVFVASPESLCHIPMWPDHRADYQEAYLVAMRNSIEKERRGVSLEKLFYFVPFLFAPAYRGLLHDVVSSLCLLAKQEKREPEMVRRLVALRAVDFWFEFRSMRKMILRCARSDQGLVELILAYDNCLEWMDRNEFRAFVGSLCFEQLPPMLDFLELEGRRIVRADTASAWQDIVANRIAELRLRQFNQTVRFAETKPSSAARKHLSWLLKLVTQVRHAPECSLQRSIVPYMSRVASGVIARNGSFDLLARASKCLDYADRPRVLKALAKHCVYEERLPRAYGSRMCLAVV